MNATIEVVEQAVDEYDEVIAELRLLGRTTRHDGTKVGALKARLQATDSRLALLRAVGVLPANLGHLRVEHDVRFLADAILQVFDDHGVSAEARRDLMALIGPERKLDLRLGEDG